MTVELPSRKLEQHPADQQHDRQKEQTLPQPVGDRPLPQPPHGRGNAVLLLIIHNADPNRWPSTGYETSSSGVVRRWSCP